MRRRIKNCFKIEGKKAFREADHIRVKWEKYREREWRKLMFALWKQKVYWHRKYIAQTALVITGSLAFGIIFFRLFYLWCLYMR